MSSPKKPKKSMSENWPLQDHNEIIALVAKIEKSAESLSEFEVNFLTELLRMAERFNKKLRLTPKQLKTLQEIESKYLLSGRLKAKIRKERGDGDG